MYRNITSYIFLLLFIMNCSVFAQTPCRTLTVDQCIEMALSSHPELESARANLRAADARTGQSLSSYYPHLSLSSDLSHSGTWRNSSPSSLSFSNSLSLSQYITDFGRTTGIVDASRANAAVAACDLRSMENQIVYSIRDAHYKYVSASALAAINKEYLSNAEAHLKQSRAFYDNGLQSKIEVSTSELDYTRAKTRYERSLNEERTTRLALFYAIGIEPDDCTSFESEFPFPCVFAGLEKILNITSIHNPEILKIKARETALRANLRSAQAEYAPDISSYARLSSRDGSISPSGTGTWGVGISLNLPIVDGGYRSYKIKEVQAQLDSILFQNQRTRQSLDLDIRSSYLTIQSMRIELDSALESEKVAQEKFYLAESRYNAGVGSNLEYMDAGASLLQARTDAVNALMEYHRAAASLEKAVGVRMNCLFIYSSGAEKS